MGRGSSKMKNGGKIIIIVFIVIAAVILIWGFKKEGIRFSEAPEKKYENFHYAAVGIKELYGDLVSYNINNADSRKKYGGIVSHHFFVASEIAKFFTGLKDQNISLIVIIGPNHFNRGNSNILISEYPYQTPWGILEPDEKSINDLLASKLVKNEEQPFEIEHSISSLVGFIKYYLPEAKIVPIILKNKTSFEEAERLADKLNQVLPDRSFVLASVDFSHHADMETAKMQDEESIKTIRSFNFSKIYSEAIDSPASVYTLLRYLKINNAEEMEYKNFNSAEFSGNLNSNDITSYIFSYFMKY
jgi:MEMO1 family protein